MTSKIIIIIMVSIHSLFPVDKTKTGTSRTGQIIRRVLTTIQFSSMSFRTRTPNSSTKNS